MPHKTSRISEAALDLQSFWSPITITQNFRTLITNVQNCWTPIRQSEFLIPDKTYSISEPLKTFTISDPLRNAELLIPPKLKKSEFLSSIQRSMFPLKHLQDTFNLIFCFPHRAKKLQTFWPPKNNTYCILSELTISTRTYCAIFLFNWWVLTPCILLQGKFPINKHLPF